EPEPAAEPERFAPEPQVVTVTANTPQAEPVNEPEISAELRERFASALAETAGNPRSTSNNLTTHSAPAQDIAMLDLTLQRQLPKLRFEAHVFATQPAQRWVKVNGKSLQEGQWITADVRLREITPQYVLLEFGQQLFSMRALSEW
ncbi:MAG: general secretion pathway protein GspB, partial [Alishewanella sp.]|nr:general secretion pathway protein GspB [Alishewanella sp.]